MRFDGKLEKWNDDRGFGFIMPTRGGDTVFVHISAFPRDGGRPKVGEPLSFEVEPAGDGKRRAVNVQRPGRRPVSQSAEATRELPPPVRTRRAGSSLLARLVPVVLVATLGAYGYTAYSGKRARPIADEAPSAQPIAPSAPSFRCDGRTQCSQVNSCEEAKFFLRNCPNTQMDGDRDGIPCESQWCTGFAGR